MNRRSFSVWGSWVGAALSVVLFLTTGAVADEAKVDAKAAASPSPLRMSPERLAGIGLAAGEPFMPPESILAGEHKPRGDVLYRGDGLIMEVYADSPATIRMTEPFPHDEFVLILEGKLILTDSAGKVQEFNVGDSLMVPKGFTGTWQMVGNFRELVAINRTVYDSVYGTGEE